MQNTTSYEVYDIAPGIDYQVYYTSIILGVGTADVKYSSLQHSQGPRQTVAKALHILNSMLSPKGS